MSLPFSWFSSDRCHRPPAGCLSCFLVFWKLLPCPSFQELTYLKDNINQYPIFKRPRCLFSVGVAAMLDMWTERKMTGLCDQQAVLLEHQQSYPARWVGPGGTPCRDLRCPAELAPSFQRTLDSCWGRTAGGSSRMPGCPQPHQTVYLWTPPRPAEHQHV